MMNAVELARSQSRTDRVRAEAIMQIEQSYFPRIQVERVRSSRWILGSVVEEFQLTGKDPISFQDRIVYVSYYRAQGNNKKAVILLPPTGGVNILDRGYAKDLCASGTSVALITHWDHQNEVSLDFTMHNNGALRALSATRHVVEFLQSEGYSSIGILGTSIGAVAAALVLGFEPRISSAAFIVGSAHFADLIAESDEAGAAALRKKRMQAFGLQSKEDYRVALQENIWIEPSAFLSRSAHKESLAVSADNDTTVPLRHQIELAQLTKANPHLQLPGNHLKVIKDTFFFHRKKIVNFFKP